MTAQQLARQIPIPSRDAINGGLNSPHNSSVIRLLGFPNDDRAKALLTEMDVGPFKLYGFKPFLALLSGMFATVHAKRPDVYNNIKTAGCYAVRHQRGSNSVISNHSWGIAVDLYFGDAVCPRGSRKTDTGMLELYPFAHNLALYWGAEFPTDDSMHLECSLELLVAWHTKGLLG